MRIVRIIFLYLYTIIVTPILGVFCIITPLLGDRKGFIWWRISRIWVLGLLSIGGVTKVTVLGQEKLDSQKSAILMSNHQTGNPIRFSMHQAHGRCFTFWHQSAPHLDRRPDLRREEISVNLLGSIPRPHAPPDLRIWTVRGQPQALPFRRLDHHRLTACRFPLHTLHRTGKDPRPALHN